MMHPPHDGGVSHRQAAFGHHLHQVSEAELEAQVPPHTQDNYLAIKVPTIKQFIQIREPGHHTALNSPDGRENRTAGELRQSHIEHVLPNTWMEYGVRDGLGCDTSAYMRHHFTTEELAGKPEPDQHWHEHAVCVHLGDRGLVVLTSCKHAGIINVLHRAQEVAGVDKIYALVGGFHLAPAPDDYLRRVMAELKQFDLEHVFPIHCSGQNFIDLAKQEMPEKLISRFLTVELCQTPPRAVRMPRAFSAAAMARCVVVPAASICRTIGSTFAVKASAATRLADAPFACASPRLVGLRSLAPGAFFCASAARVRSAISAHSFSAMAS
jgi:metal-dependent hydrolase (beta-lactamase superfamily II)